MDGVKPEQEGVESGDDVDDSELALLEDEEFDITPASPTGSSTASFDSHKSSNPVKQEVGESTLGETSPPPLLGETTPSTAPSIIQPSSTLPPSLPPPPPPPPPGGPMFVNPPPPPAMPGNVLPNAAQYTIYHLPTNIIPAVQGSPSELVRLSPYSVPQSYLTQRFRPLALSFRPWEVQMISNPPNVGFPPPYQAATMLEPLTQEELCKLTPLKLFERHRQFLLIIKGKMHWVRNAEDWLEDVLAGVDIGQLDCAVKIKRKRERKSARWKKYIDYGSDLEEHSKSVVEGKEEKCAKHGIVEVGTDKFDIVDDDNPQTPRVDPPKPSPSLHSIGISTTEAGPSTIPASESNPIPKSSDESQGIGNKAGKGRREKRRKRHRNSMPLNTEHFLLASVGMFKTNDGKLWRWPGQRDMRYGEDLHMPRQPAYSGIPAIHLPKNWLSTHAGDNSVADDDGYESGEWSEVNEDEVVKGGNVEITENVAEAEAGGGLEGKGKGKAKDSVDPAKEQAQEEESMMRSKEGLKAAEEEAVAAAGYGGAEEDCAGVAGVASLAVGGAGAGAAGPCTEKQAVHGPEDQNTESQSSSSSAREQSSSSSSSSSQNLSRPAPPSQSSTTATPAASDERLYPTQDISPTPTDKPLPLHNPVRQSSRKTGGKYKYPSRQASRPVYAFTYAKTPTPVSFCNPAQNPPPQPETLERLQLQYFVQQRRYKIEFAKLDAQIAVLTQSIEEILGTTIEEYTQFRKSGLRFEQKEIPILASEEGGGLGIKQDNLKAESGEIHQIHVQESAKEIVEQDDEGPFVDIPVPKWTTTFSDASEIGDYDEQSFWPAQENQEDGGNIQYPSWMLNENNEWGRQPNDNSQEGGSPDLRILVVSKEEDGGVIPPLVLHPQEKLLSTPSEHDDITNVPEHSEEAGGIIQQKEVSESEQCQIKVASDELATENRFTWNKLKGNEPSRNRHSQSVSTYSSDCETGTATSGDQDSKSAKPRKMWTDGRRIEERVDIYDTYRPREAHLSERAMENYLDGFRNQIRDVRAYSQENRLNPNIIVREKKRRDAKGKGKQASGNLSHSLNTATEDNTVLPSSCTSANTSPISRLPTEILMQILSIPRYTVQAGILTRVCRRWYSIVIPMIYTRVEFGDTVEDIESELLERYRIKRANQQKMRLARQQGAEISRLLGNEGGTASDGVKNEESDPEDFFNGTQILQFREGNAVLAVMPVSIGIMRALCKPHIGKHVRWLAYRGTSGTSFPNRDTLAVYSGLDLTNLIRARNAAQKELFNLTKNAVRNMRRLETLVVDSGEEQITNALLGVLKWSAKLRVLHLSAVNIRELQFVRGKGSMWWDHRAKNLVGPDDEKEKGKMADNKADGSVDTEVEKSTPPKSISSPNSAGAQDLSGQYPNDSSKSTKAQDAHPYDASHTSSPQDHEHGFSYPLEVLSLFRCGYHLTRDNHTKKVNKKGIIQVAEEEELKASAHLIPLLRRCKHLKTLRIESSHMEPEAVLGSWAILKDKSLDKVKEDEKPGVVAVTGTKEKEESHSESSSNLIGVVCSASGSNVPSPKDVLLPNNANSEQDNEEEKETEDATPVDTDLQSQENAEGRVYLTFPKLESLTLRGCGFFRGFETPPTWISSRGYERFFLTHRIKQLAWSGWILNRHLKLNNPAFVKVARHLGESLTALSITHFYDDTKVTILPSEAHGVKFSHDRLRAFLSHLKNLEFFDLKLLRIKMSQVLEVARILKNNNMKKFSITNIYGSIGVDEAKELVECMPVVRMLVLKWLIYPDDQLAKQVYRREEEEAAEEAGDGPGGQPGATEGGDGAQTGPGPVTTPDGAAGQEVQGPGEGSGGQNGSTTLPLLPLLTAETLAPEKEIFTSIEQLAAVFAPITSLKHATINFICPRPSILSHLTDPELNYRLLAHSPSSPRPRSRNPDDRTAYLNSLRLHEHARAEFVYAIRAVANAFLSTDVPEGAYRNLISVTVGYFLNEKWMNVPIHFMRRDNKDAEKITGWWVEKWDMPTGVVEWLVKKVGGGAWDGKMPLMDEEEKEGGADAQDGPSKKNGERDKRGGRGRDRASGWGRGAFENIGNQPFAIYTVF